MEDLIQGHDAEWTAKAGMPLTPLIRDRAHLRELGFLHVADVDTCIQLIRDSIAEAPSVISTPGHCRRDCRRSGFSRTSSSLRVR